MPAKKARQMSGRSNLKAKQRKGFVAMRVLHFESDCLGRAVAKNYKFVIFGKNIRCWSLGWVSQPGGGSAGASTERRGYTDSELSLFGKVRKTVVPRLSSLSN